MLSKRHDCNLSSYGGDLTLIDSFETSNFRVSLPLRRSTTVSLETV